MTYQDIEAFLEIVQTGSISHAAENLAVTQPTLSHRLKALENELDIDLIKREQGVRRIELTDAGRKFIPTAEKWKQLWNTTADLANGNGTKRLQISAAHSINSYIMPSVYKRFLSEHPDLSISLYTHHSNEAYRAMETGDVDIAFIANPMYTNRLATIPLFKERMVGITSAPETERKSTPKVSPTTLKLENEIQLDWSREFLLWHDYWFGISVKPKIFTDDMKILENFIGMENAWAIAPLSAARAIVSQTPAISMFPLTDPPPDRITYMLSTNAQTMEPDIIQLVELLKRTAQDAGFTLFDQ